METYRRSSRPSVKWNTDDDDGNDDSDDGDGGGFSCRVLRLT